MSASQELDRIMLMLKTVSDESIIGMAIKQALAKNENPIDIIAWLKSQAQDGPAVMGRVIGVGLTHDILNFLT